MFYKMIENKCKEWYSSDQCTVRNLIEYIEKTGQMRDAQVLSRVMRKNVCRLWLNEVSQQ